MSKSIRKFIVNALVVGMAFGLAVANPALVPGVWKNISPTECTWTSSGNMSLGMAIDPSNSNVLYLTVCALYASPSFPKGIYKSTDGGSTWTNKHHFDSPNHILVDPSNPNHLFLTDGVAGGTNGFYASTDGGDSWFEPAGWLGITKTCGVDMGIVVADPTNFNHILLGSHGWWGDGNGGITGGGITESTDGGTSWIIHANTHGWDAGSPGIAFLYDPAHGVNDNKTWLFLINGFWRTTDAGANWTKVSDAGIPHGFENLYRAKNGTLYAGSWPHPFRSTDNGLTWTELSNNGIPSSACYGVMGDGENMYTMIDPNNGGQTPWLTSKENDGLTWKNYVFNGTTQTLSRGPIQMKFDAVKRIMYASSWEAGLWALKSPDLGTGVVTRPVAGVARAKTATKGKAMVTSGNRLTLSGKLLAMHKSKYAQGAMIAK